MYDDSTASDGSDRDGNGSATRRRFLRGTAAAGVAAAGFGAAATNASAQLGPTAISVNGRGGGWSADGEFPVVDELVVFIHGWFGNTGVTAQAGSVSGSLEDGGYSLDRVAAIRWPATNINFVGASADTENVGEVVADMAETFYNAGGGNIRLIGHSLGGRCVYWTTTKLSDGYELELVAGLGAAASGSTVCGDPWNPGMDNACVVRNVHSGRDSIVGGAYGGIGGNALGADGAGCSVAPNYEDVDVTGAVGSHLAYLGNDTVGQRLADAIANADCDAGGGTSGSGGSDDGGSDSGGNGSIWGSGGSDDGGSGSLWGSGGSDGGDGGFGWF